MNHAFENEIFEEFRNKQKEIHDAIALLKEHGYIIYEKHEV